MSISIEEFKKVIGEFIKSKVEWIKSNQEINKKILFFIYFTSSALNIIISITCS